MNKAKLLTKHFGVYGQGHFDLTLEEVNTILEILNMDDSAEIEALLNELYERLSETRLG